MFCMSYTLVFLMVMRPPSPTRTDTIFPSTTRFRSMTPDQTHARRYRILVVLCLSLVMVILGNTVLNVAIPTLVRELDATQTELQWMVDAYALVFAGLDRKSTRMNSSH